MKKTMMRKNKSMLTKTVFYGLGVSLIIGSLVVPLGLKPDFANNTLVRADVPDNEGIKIADNSLVDFDLNEQSFVLSPTAVNQDLVKLFEIKNGALIVKDKTNLENYLKSHDGKLDLNELGEVVKIIKSKCFQNIKNLQTIIIPRTVIEIHGFAFQWCKNLQTINIPKSVNYIGSYVFSGCESLTSDSVTNNSPVLFDWWVRNHQYNGQTMSQMFKINLSQFKNSAGKNFNVIGDYAFENCTKLTNIIIPKPVKEIGNFVFDKCTNLAPNSVINNSPVLFDWWVKNHQYDDGKTMSQMSEINLSQLKNSDGKEFSIIGNGAFTNCTNLTKIIIPELVKEIGHGAFEKCTNLTSDSVINNSPVLFDWWIWNHQYNNKTMAQMIQEINTIDLSAFENSCGKKFSSISSKSFWKIGSKLNKVIIPESVKKIYYWAFANSNLESVTFQGNNKNLNLGFNSFLTSSNTTYWFESLILFNRLKKTNQLENANIDENHCTITVEKSFIFNGQCSLIALTDKGKQKTLLDVPDLTKTIASNAFQGSQASTITIADSVIAIGDNVFSDCPKLENIEFGIQSQLQQIVENTFSGCLTLINITLPSSLTIIGAGAFKDCTSLTSIAIPGLVSEIGERAFDNCNYLESVTFLGQNRKFSLGKGAFPQNINQFYFNDENLFNSLRIETCAGIISSKCVLVQKHFEIEDNSSLIAITSDAQELSELHIPGFVKTIGDGTNVVFGNSAKFQKVIIPTSVDKIKANAFNGCSSLKEVIINSTGVTIELNAFVNMPNTQYYVPANSDGKEQLKKIGIKESQIHFLNLSSISIDYSTISIIVGAIVFTIIVLGLGIGIPMRKQHRINVR